MSYIRLANGKRYKILDYSSRNRFTVIVGAEKIEDVMSDMTSENLSEICFFTDAGTLSGVFRNILMYSHTINGDHLTIFINDSDLCRHGLVLDNDNRILSAPVQRYAPVGAVIVDSLPDGDITGYRYVNGEYIYDPLPQPEPEPPAPTLEDRVGTLEATTDDMILLMAEMIGG